MINVDLTGSALLSETPEDTGIGIVTPSDLVLDREYWRWLPEMASLYITRTHSVELPVSVEMAAEVSDAEVVARATRDLATADPEVVVYACTSGSFVHGLAGERRLRDAMHSAGARRAITTSGTLLEALDALGVERLAVGTPYDAEVSDRLSDFLRETGREVVANAFLGLTDNIFRVRRETVMELALAADRPEAEAVFLSCTNLRTLDVLEEATHRLGKPVLSANQVTMWAALRAAGLAEDWETPPPFPHRPHRSPAPAPA